MIDRGSPERMCYIESSAVLSLLLAERPVDEVIAPIMREPHRAVTSVLTLVECRRTILRAESSGRLDRVSADSARYRLANFSEQCNVFDLDEDIVSLASEPMGDNLLRTLDAIHVATALVVRRSIGPVEFVSLDRRLRSVADSSGFTVLPLQLPPSLDHA